MRRVLLLTAVLIASCLTAVADEKPDAPRVDLYGDPLPEGAVARLGTVRLRGAGTGLACLPGGKVIVTCGRDDRTVRFFDLATGKQIRQFQETDKDNYLQTLAVSPDGKLLALGGYKGVSLWELDTGKELRRLRAGSVRSLLFGPDGKTLIVGGSDFNPAIRVYDLDTGKERRRMMWHQRDVTQLALAPDGQTLISASWDKRVHACDLATGTEKWVLSDRFWTNLHLACLLPDGRSLLIGGSRWQQGAQATEAFVSIHDLSSGRELRKLENVGRHIQRGVLSPDGRTLAISDYAGKVRLWDLEAGKERQQLDVRGSVQTMLPDGNTLVLSAGSALICVDLKTSRPLHSFDGHVGEVGSLSFSADGKALASCSYHEPAIRVWDVATMKSTHVIRGHEGEQVYIRAVEFLPNDSIVSGASDSTLRVWDAKTGREIRKFLLTESTKREDQQQVLAFQVSNDGRTLVVNSTGFSEEQPSRFSIWEIATGKLLTKRDEPGGHFHHHPSFSPDGKMFARNPGREFALMEVASGRELSRIKSDEVFGWSSAFSHDQRVLALTTYVSTTTESRLSSTSSDHKIRLFEASSLKERLAIPVSNYVTLLAFSPDQRYLAACIDRRLYLFDAQAGQLAWKSPELDSGPRSIAFSADGRQLASGHGDSSILLWDTSQLIKREERNAP